MDIDWKALSIEQGAAVEDELATSESLEGLSAQPDRLQAEFLLKAAHLDEVRAAQSNLVEMAGRTPLDALETSMLHLDAAMVVAELNGAQTREGLLIPLSGVALEQVRLDCADLDEEHWILRLGIDVPTSDSEQFVRTFSLPKGSIRPRAEWFGNELRISH